MVRGLVPLLVLGTALSAAGCAQNKAADHPDRTIIPEETQERSQNMAGQQQNSMSSLNQTSSEQAAAAHYNSTRPVEQSKREKKKK